MKIQQATHVVLQNTHNSNNELLLLKTRFSRLLLLYPLMTGSRTVIIPFLYRCCDWLLVIHMAAGGSAFCLNVVSLILSG